jgi:hypothetical protein
MRMQNDFIRSIICRSRKSELIYEINAQISAELDMERLLPLIVGRIKSALDLSYCAILLKEGNDLVIRAVTEYPENIVGKKIPLGQGISGRCALGKRNSWSRISANAIFMCTWATASSVRNWMCRSSSTTSSWGCSTSRAFARTHSSAGTLNS